MITQNGRHPVKNRRRVQPSYIGDVKKYEGRNLIQNGGRPGGSSVLN